jgi:hypothetical protein
MKLPETVEEYDKLNVFQRIYICFFHSKTWVLIHHAKSLDTDMEVIRNLIQEHDHLPPPKTQAVQAFCDMSPNERAQVVCYFIVDRLRIKLDIVKTHRDELDHALLENRV